MEYAETSLPEIPIDMEEIMDTPLSEIPASIEEIERRNEGSQHSQQENVQATLSIVNKPLNFYKNQFVFSFFSSPTLKITYPFSRQRYMAQITRNNYEAEITNILLEYVNPNVINVIHARPRELYEEILEIITRNFDNKVQMLYTNTFLQDVTDEDTQREIIKETHQIGHRSAQGIAREIMRKYYWPNVMSQSQKYVDNCTVCQQVKYERHPEQYKLKLTPTAKEPFDIVHMDIFSIGRQKYLTAIDIFSKFVMYEPLESHNIADIASAYVKLISHYKLPKQIVTDNQFDVTLFKDLLKIHKIEHHLITPLHPNSNSPIERAHGTIIEIMRTITNSEE